jgi:hypothetical protein
MPQDVTIDSKDLDLAARYLQGLVGDAIWERTPEAQKEKYREQVRGILRMLNLKEEKDACRALLMRERPDLLEKYDRACLPDSNSGPEEYGDIWDVIHPLYADENGWKT